MIYTFIYYDIPIQKFINCCIILIGIILIDYFNKFLEDIKRKTNNLEVMVFLLDDRLDRLRQ